LRSNSGGASGEKKKVVAGRDARDCIAAGTRLHRSTQRLEHFPIILVHSLSFESSWRIRLV